MKRISLVLVILSGLSVWAGAQGDFRFGFQVSPVVSWMESNDKFINSNGSNLGLRLGMKADIFFAEKYAFSTGINFAFNHGGRLRHDVGGNLLPKSELSDPKLFDLPNGVNIDYGIQYLEIPLSLKMITNEVFRDFRFYFEVPVITLGIETQARGDITGAMIQDAEDELIGRDVNPLFLQWGLGGGVEYNLRGDGKGGTNLVAGVFYNQGFTDVTRNAGVKYIRDENELIIQEIPEDSNASIRGITLFLGVLF